jgi:hypothetical protein
MYNIHLFLLFLSFPYCYWNNLVIGSLLAITSKNFYTFPAQLPFPM